MSRYLFVGVIIGAILGGGFGMLLALIAGYNLLDSACRERPEPPGLE